MTTTIPRPCSIDFARPLGELEHFFSLNDQHPAAALRDGRPRRRTHYDFSLSYEGRS